METNLAFIAYIIAVVSLGVSLYAVYLISELKDRLNLPQVKKHKPKPPIKVQRPKGHWD